LAGAFLMSLLAALKAYRADATVGFPLVDSLQALAQPSGLAGWLQVIGLLGFGATCGLLTAAVAAARRGAGQIVATST
jgi:hypothetical protein